MEHCINHTRLPYQASRPEFRSNTKTHGVVRSVGAKWKKQDIGFPEVVAGCSL